MKTILMILFILLISPLLFVLIVIAGACMGMCVAPYMTIKVAMAELKKHYPGGAQ